MSVNRTNRILEGKTEK